MDPRYRMEKTSTKASAVIEYTHRIMSWKKAHFPGFRHLLILTFEGKFFGKILSFTSLSERGPLESGAF